MHQSQPSSAFEAARADRSHAVHFYEEDDDLAATVARFVEEGLRLGQPAIVVASREHLALYLDRLGALDVDVEGARAAGMLTVLDATETLAKLMVGERPDAAVFQRLAGGLVESISTRGPRIRGCGAPQRQRPFLFALFVLRA